MPRGNGRARLGRAEAAEATQPLAASYQRESFHGGGDNAALIWFKKVVSLGAMFCRDG